MDELDEYDECKVKVGITGQWSRGKRHPEVCHAASIVILTFLLCNSIFNRIEEKNKCSKTNYVNSLD